MDRRAFGSTQRDVAVVGQGTWNLESGSKATVIDALHRGIDLGMTHIDCAELYGAGKSEQRVGEALKGRRDEVFLVSKVLPSNASRRGVVKACEASLARLGTDRLDCYLLHWRGSYALEDTLAGFAQLLRDGKILAWGVSNFDVADLEEIHRLSSAIQAHPMTCNQVLYHPEERAIEHAVLPWCAQHGVAVVAYSPFGSNETFPRRNFAGGKVLQEIAAAHGATPRQVALRFLLRHPSVFAIPKASTTLHVTENAGAGGLRLTEAEITRISAAFPLGPPPRALPMI